MRWQVYTSLAYGARGVLYFCYWSPVGTTFAWGGALMVPRSLAGGPSTYQPGPKLAQAARINAKLLTYGTFLLQAAHTAIFLSNGTASAVVPVPAYNGGGITAIGGCGAGPTWAALLGFYESPSPEWKGAVLLQNQDWVYPAVLDVTLAANATVWEVDPITGAVAQAWDDAPELPGFQLNVDSGDARLLLLS